MVKDLHKSLLGRPAIEALELVARVGAIQEKKRPELNYLKALGNWRVNTPSNSKRGQSPFP